MVAPVILLNTAVDLHNGRECEILISQYAARVSDAGGVPMLMPSIEKEEIIHTLLDRADGVLLIGGKDYPPSFYGETAHPATQTTRMRPHFDLAFACAALQSELPVFGICAGCQLLNIALGGKLIQHLGNAEAHTDGATHPATIVRDGFFARAAGKKTGDAVTVNSFHHQAVDPAYLGNGLVVTATAFDGSVEAVEMPGPRMIAGVQFHPERMDDLAPLIFRSFIAEAAKRISR